METALEIWSGVKVVEVSDEEEEEEENTHSLSLELLLNGDFAIAFSLFVNPGRGEFTWEKGKQRLVSEQRWALRLGHVVLVFLSVTSRISGRWIGPNHRPICPVSDRIRIGRL